MRLALRTQISIALAAILLGLLFASAIVTAMMRSVDDELGEIEGSAGAIAALHELTARFDGARSVLDAFVLTGDVNDYERFVELDRSIGQGIETLERIETQVQGDSEDITAVVGLHRAYRAWIAEVALDLVERRRALPVGLAEAAEAFETDLGLALAPIRSGGEATPAQVIEAGQQIERALSGIARLAPGAERLAAWERLVGEVSELLSRPVAVEPLQDIDARVQAWRLRAHQLTQAVLRDEQRLRERLGEAKQHPAMREFVEALQVREQGESREQIDRLQQSRDSLWLFQISLLVPTVPALLALGVTGLALIRLQRVLGPINQAAAALAAGDYGARVRVDGLVELDGLKCALNGMAARLEHSQKAGRVVDELRTLLHSARRLEEAYAIIGRYGPQLLPETAGGVYLVNASRTLVESVLTWNESRMRGQMVFGLEDCWSLRSGQVHFHAGDDRSLACPHLKEQDADATLCVPLVADDEVLGVLHVCCLGDVTGPELVDDRRALAVALAELVSRALAALRTSERLRDQSIRDPLSGLFNRRYLDATFERELNRSRRNADPLSCLVIDIDHFKSFNDRFGHAAGDAVIAEFGRLLLANVRDADIVCRLGGEEFVILLPQAARDNATRRAQRLLGQIRQMHSRAANARYGAVTASIGVSSYPEHGDQASILLQAADAALYRAKRNGRDRVEVATARSAEPQVAAVPDERADENYELPLSDSD